VDKRRFTRQHYRLYKLDIQMFLTFNKLLKEIARMYNTYSGLHSWTPEKNVVRAKQPESQMSTIIHDTARR